MTSATIWRRRVVLMAIVGLLVAIPVTLLLAGDDESEGGGAVGSQPAPELGPDLSDRGLAVDYRVPEGWEARKRQSAIRISNPDRTVTIVVAAPAAASEADAVLDEALAAVRGGYDDVEISPGSGKQIGGLEAEGAVVRATADGVALRILIAVARGERRAYLVEVFTAAGVSATELRAAQAALNSLRLRG